MRRMIPSQNHMLLTQLSIVLWWIKSVGWMRRMIPSQNHMLLTQLFCRWFIDGFTDVFLRSLSIPSGHVGQRWWHTRIHRGWREFRSIGKETFGGSSVATRYFLSFLVNIFFCQGVEDFLWTWKNWDDEVVLWQQLWFVNPDNKLRVSSVDLMIVHYHLAQLEYLGALQIYDIIRQFCEKPTRCCMLYKSVKTDKFTLTRESLSCFWTGCSWLLYVLFCWPLWAAESDTSEHAIPPNEILLQRFVSGWVLRKEKVEEEGWMRWKICWRARSKIVRHERNHHQHKTGLPLLDDVLGYPAPCHPSGFWTGESAFMAAVLNLFPGLQLV